MKIIIALGIVAGGGVFCSTWGHSFIFTQIHYSRYMIIIPTAIVDDVGVCAGRTGNCGGRYRNYVHFLIHN
jgi:hypothetical protein